MDFLEEEQGFLADKFQDWGDDPRPETWAAIQKQLRRQRMRRLFYRGGYLASILVLLLLSWFAVRQYQSTQQPELAHTTAPAPNPSGQPEARRSSQAEQAQPSAPAQSPIAQSAADPQPSAATNQPSAATAPNPTAPAAQSNAQDLGTTESQASQITESRSLKGTQPNRAGNQPTIPAARPADTESKYVAAETSTNRPARTTRRRRSASSTSQSPSGQRQRDDRGAIAPGHSSTSQSPATAASGTTGLNGGISLNGIRKPRNRRAQTTTRASVDAYGRGTAPTTIAANASPVRNRRKGNSRHSQANRAQTLQSAQAQGAATAADQLTTGAQIPSSPPAADPANTSRQPAQSSAQPQVPAPSQATTTEAQAATQAIAKADSLNKANSLAKADSLNKAQATPPTPEAPSPWQWSLGLRYGPMGRLIQVDRSAYPGPMKVQRLGADLQSRYAVELAAALERRLTNAFSLQGQLGIGYLHDVLTYAQSQESAITFDVTPLKDGSGYQLNRQWVPEPQLVNYKLGLLTLNTSLYLQAMLPSAPIGLRLGGGISLKALQTQQRLGQTTQTTALDGIVPFLQSELFLRRRPNSRLEGTLFIRQYLNTLSHPEQAIRVRPWQAGIGLVWRF